VTDSLVAAGLLRDDSFAWVHENCQALGAVDPANPRIEVAVFELWQPSEERKPEKPAPPWIPAPPRTKTLADVAKLARLATYPGKKPP